MLDGDGEGVVEEVAGPGDGDESGVAVEFGAVDQGTDRLTRFAGGEWRGGVWGEGRWVLHRFGHGKV